MVRLRLNRRLQGRVDSADILQEAYLEAAKRLGDYLDERPRPFYLASSAEKAGYVAQFVF